MIRVPTLTDLSDPAQVRSLTSLLTEIRNDLSRTAMPEEETRNRDDTQATETRFRVVKRSVGPSDSSYDEDQTHEVHFFAGGKWMRVTLEDV